MFRSPPIHILRRKRFQKETHGSMRTFARQLVAYSQIWFFAVNGVCIYACAPVVTPLGQATEAAVHDSASVSVQGEEKRKC